LEGDWQRIYRRLNGPCTTANFSGTHGPLTARGSCNASLHVIFRDNDASRVYSLTAGGVEHEVNHVFSFLLIANIDY
jgi:hypothetical protein